MKHNIESIEFCKQTSNLSFIADGANIEVQGEFLISGGILRHTHLFPDGEEMEIEVLVDNEIDLNKYPSNIEVFGNRQSGVHVVSESYYISTDGVTDVYDSAEEAADDICKEIANHFDRIDDWDLSRIHDDLESYFDISHTWE